MEDQHSHRAEAFGPAEIGALAHLYRGEMYQSKVWRNRLDTTANWAIVITGIALSVTFSNADASPIPILLVSWVWRRWVDASAGFTVGSSRCC
jgi:uncharacterized membrane protein